MTIKQNKIGARIQFFSAGYIYIYVFKNLVNYTPFRGNNQLYMKIRVRILFLSAGYIYIFKNLVNFTPFCNNNKRNENQGQDTISYCGVY